ERTGCDVDGGNAGVSGFGAGEHRVRPPVPGVFHLPGGPGRDRGADRGDDLRQAQDRPDRRGELPPRGGSVAVPEAGQLPHRVCHGEPAQQHHRGPQHEAMLFILRLMMKILAAPVVLALTLFTWACFGLLYVSSFIFGLVSTVVALLGIAVLVTYSPQNGIILLVMAFLVSPVGLPMAAAWLVGKVQDLRYAIQDAVYG